MVEADDGKKRALDVAAASDAAGPVACFVCGGPGVKYRCPRCERITCSLDCCLKHKKELDCDGKRDRTKYVAVKSFTDADLSSDYFFLEEVSRSANSASRSRSQLGVNVRHYGQRGSSTVNAATGPGAKKRRVNGPVPSVNPDLPSDWMSRFPVATQLLAEHAAKRGVALTLLAPGMSKRVRNSSYMDIKKKTLFWRIEWDFPFADVPPNLVETRADDSQTLFALLSRYFTKSPENVTVRSKLKRYAVADWEQHVTLLLRKEFVPASQPQYYRLDGNASIESNLKRKAVVEFPIITVVPNTEVNQYPVAFDAIEVVSETDDVADRVQVEAPAPAPAIHSENATKDCESVEMTDSADIDEGNDQKPTEMGGEAGSIEDSALDAPAPVNTL